MIYDFILNTGGLTIIESSSSNFNNNYKGDFILDSFYIPLLDRTGTHDILASLNSQTLVETAEAYTPNQFENIYSGNGDYYFKTGESISKMNFLGNLNIYSLNEKNLFFDLRSPIQAAIGTGLNSGQIEASLMDDLKIKMTGYTGDLNKLDYFLNGQKIYSGESYTILNNTGFKFNESTEGKIFAIPKKEKTIQITGFNSDIYGYKFIENEVNLYVNGMEQNKNLWLELSTGVILIETGIICEIFGETYSSQVINL